MKKAIVLLSGGLDSATVLAKARHDGYDTNTLGFDYGQRHDSELNAAKELALTFSINPHKIVKLDLRTIGGSSLTSDAIPFLKLLIPLATSPIRLDILPRPNSNTTSITTIAICQIPILIENLYPFY